jgi:hypothetical protein
MMRHAAPALVLALVFTAQPSLGVDTLTSGKRLVVAPGNIVLLDVAGVTLPLPAPGGAADPTLVGGTFRVFDVGNPGNQAIYALPASGWKGLGNPPGASGYRYTGAGSPADPCQIDLRDKEIDVNCNDPGTAPTVPFTGEGGATLSLGGGMQRYCTVFGGILANNNATQYKRVKALAPSACEPSPAPVDQGLAGRMAVVKAQAIARFVSRPGLTLLPDTAGEAPNVVGATVRVFDTGTTGGDITYPLPASRWRTARQGYKYRGPIGDPCPTVLLMPTVVKAICRREAVDLTTPFAGDATFVITAGTSARYCVQFGGDELRNDAILLKRKTAPAPGSCPSSASGAFLEEGVGVW